MRSKQAKKRQKIADPIYKSKLVARMINVVMKDGKKSLAEKIVYGALESLSQEKKQSLQIFEKAVSNVMPKMEVRSRRIGGATYQIPQPVKHERSEALAIRWIVNAARKKKGKPMKEKLYEEIKDAYSEVGDAIKKRDEVHKMAEANKAFSHLRV